jgi:nitric oxide reductase large subunit
MSLPRTETLLVFACAAAAGILGASEFMTLFEFTPPGGEAIESLSAGDQHGYAQLVLAGMAMLLLAVAMATARPDASDQGLSLSRIAAFGVAVCGVVALLLFLLGDLPDVNKIGTLDDARSSFIDAKAEPKAGFWLEMVGSLVLAVCGVALATLGPDQLRTGRRESKENIRERARTRARTLTGSRRSG